MATVGFNKKQFFFDRQIVIDAVGRASAKNLSQAVSFIRRSARSSLRRRKKVSPPGQPPSVHTQDRVATLKNIWFVFDPAQRSVVVGPLKLNGSRLEGSNRQTVPSLHELGGTAVVGGRRKRKRRAKYASRPFMGPAMERELPKFAGLWANSVK
jgi:hypothetical protein